MAYYDSYGRRLDGGDPIASGFLIAADLNAKYQAAITPFLTTSPPPRSTSSSSDSSSDWSWSSPSSTPDTSSSASYGGSYSGTYTPRVLTPEEIEERRLRLEEFEKNLKALGLFLLSPAILPIKGYFFLEKKLTHAVWKKLPEKWKWYVIPKPDTEPVTWARADESEASRQWRKNIPLYKPPRDNTNFTVAKIITRAGIAATIGATVSGITAVNIYQMKMAYEYPPTQIVEGPSGKIYDSRYLCSQNENTSYTGCKVVTYLDYKEPDCIKINILDTPEGQPQKYTVTDLSYAGSMYGIKDGLQCTSNDTWIGKNSISCNAKEIFYCNNTQTLEVLHAALLSNSTPQDLKPDAQSVPHNVLGIGITTIPAGDSIAIERVISGGPAERAGILGGDDITHINGRGIEHMTYDEAMREINDQSDISVKLTLNRFGKTVRVNVQKELIYTRKEVPPPTSPTSQQIRVSTPAPTPSPVQANTIQGLSTNTARPVVVNATTTSPAALTDKFIVTASALNLREEPSTQSPSKGLLENGSCVTVTAGASGSFVKVTTIDVDSRNVFITGYVAEGYLKPRNKSDSYACRADFSPR